MSVTKDGNLMRVRVGGVHEPFNLPWLLAAEAGEFERIGVSLDFCAVAGGTGALVGALDDGSLDLATILTEGAVAAVGNGCKARIHAAFVDSPLLWGIHTAVAADAPQRAADLADKTFAISRHGSGSELMAYVLADREKFRLGSDKMRVVGGIDGAAEALPARTADVFLWERFVTAPLVERGVFARIGEIATPWPAFVLAGSPAFLRDHAPLVDRLLAIALTYALRLKSDRPYAANLIVARYGMSLPDAHAWLDLVAWPTSVGADADVLSSVISTMSRLGRIPASFPASHLFLAPPSAPTGTESPDDGIARRSAAVA